MTFLLKTASLLFLFALHKASGYTPASAVTTSTEMVSKISNSENKNNHRSLSGEQDLEDLPHGIWINIRAQLPYPVSDMTATVVTKVDPNGNIDHNPNNVEVYIVGGCVDPLGNSRGKDGNFYCGAITGRVAVFDSQFQEFRISVDAPRERYRHAAVFDPNQRRLWLIGGRSLSDEIVREIDVFDIGTEKWLDYNITLPEEYSVSDHDAWIVNDGQGHVYITGGYFQNYTTSNYTILIDTDESILQNQLVFERKADLLHSRGDIHVVGIPHKGVTYAYVTGGFTSDDFWCKPLNTTERYDPVADIWTNISDLHWGRGDLALVNNGPYVYSLGGEAKTDCQADVAEATKPINEVEMLDTSIIERAIDQAKAKYPRADAKTVVSKAKIPKMWRVVDDLPADRFRFTAVSISNMVFAFGGQQLYNKTCDCFKTSDVISVYVEGYTVQQNVHDDNRSPGVKSGIAVGTIVGAALLLFALYKLAAMGKHSNNVQEQPTKVGETA